MNMFQPHYPGQYVPGASLLHRLDPRLKLLGLPVLVAATFASRHPGQLTVMLLAAAAMLLFAGGPWGRCWRCVWALRWLLVFTLLLHLLLSPGRTLFGSAWLSLDGLALGMTVCAQLLLAVCFSTLLTLTTSPQELAAAATSLLAPLGRAGLKVGELANLLLLTLHFIPVLQEEGRRQLDNVTAGEEIGESGTMLHRLRRLGRMLAPLVLRVVDRADALAMAIARGEEVLPVVPSLAPWWRMGWLNLLASICGIGVLTVVFGVLS